jgi:hypothetical protein
MPTDPPYFRNPNFKNSWLGNISRPRGWTAGRWESDGVVEMFNGSQPYLCKIHYAKDPILIPDHGPERYKNQAFTGATCTPLENDDATPIDGAPKVELGWDFQRCAFKVGKNTAREREHGPTKNCPWPSTAGLYVESIHNGPVRDFAMPEGWTDASVSSNSYLWGINVVDDQEQLRRCYPSLLVREPGNDKNAMVSGSELTCCNIDDRDQYHDRITCENAVNLKFMPKHNQYRTDDVPGWIPGAGVPGDGSGM